MSTYDRVAGLRVQIDSYELEPLSLGVSSGFRRLTTVVRLRGNGEEGIGEDVTYDGPEQEAQQQAGPIHPLTGSFTLAEFSERVGGLELFPAPPAMDASAYYRRWAFESAALDLALRQAGRSVAEQLDLEPAPTRFVVSRGLGNPPSIAPLMKLLEHDPNMRFKLDATSAWTPELFDELAGTGRVDVIDLKGAYFGTPVDQAPDPLLYGRVARAFPEAWIEDPALTPETESALAGAEDRITWDAPIHSVADIEALSTPPRVLNIKPSRFGSLEALFAAYDYCRERAIGMYGGGQYELGPGREQIQLLASLFHPGSANDIAPTGYHHAEIAPEVPRTPLAPGNPQPGFRFT